MSPPRPALALRHLWKFRYLGAEFNSHYPLRAFPLPTGSLQPWPATGREHLLRNLGHISINREIKCLPYTMGCGLDTTEATCAHASPVCLQTGTTYLSPRGRLYSLPPRRGWWPRRYRARHPTCWHSGSSGCHPPRQTL